MLDDDISRKKTLEQGVMSVKKGLKVNTIAWIAAAVVLVAAVPINMIFSKVDVSIDVTPYNAYSLSDEAMNAINSLEKPVDMYVLYRLDDLYEGTSPGQADYMKADMYVTTMRQMAESEKITLHEVNISDTPGFVDEKDPEGYMGLSDGDILLECNEMKRNVPFRTLFATNSETGSIEFYGENAIMGAIDYLQSGITPTIYFTTGHGENPLESYSNLENMLKTQNYAAKSLDISAEGAIPEDATTVLFAGPMEDISSEEKDILMDYAAKGGNITMLLSPNEKKIDYKNIEAVLKSYELAMDYNRVYETESSYHADDDKYTIMCKFYDTDFNQGLIKTQGDIALYTSPSRSFYSIGNDDSTIEAEPLIETYETAASELCGGTRTDIEIPGGILYLAAKAEDPSRNNSKLFVMGSADFMTDKTLEQPYTLLMPYLFLTSVSWMDDANTEMLYPARVQTTDYITIPNKGTGHVILAIMIAFPILISAAGVIVWARRRNA